MGNGNINCMDEDRTEHRSLADRLGHYWLLHYPI